MIEFTPEMVTALNNSFADKMIVEIASASKAGMPTSPSRAAPSRGTTSTSPSGSALSGPRFATSRKPAVLPLVPQRRRSPGLEVLRRADVYTDGELRQQVMDRAVEAELNRDPERKGAAVIVRIDKIVMGSQVLQER